MVIADFSLFIIILPLNLLIVTSKQPKVQFCVNYDYATVGNTAVIQSQQQVWEILRKTASSTKLYKECVAKAVKNTYRNMPSSLIFRPYLYQQVKMLTGESGPKGTCKSAHISESIIVMKIGPFLKWPGEVGSDGCMFIVCSVPSTFEVTSSFFYILYFSYLLWNLGFYFLVRVCYTADCNVFTLRRSSCSSILCEHGSCMSVLPLPPPEAAS